MFGSTNCQIRQKMLHQPSGEHSLALGLRDRVISHRSYQQQIPNLGAKAFRRYFMLVTPSFY